MPKFLHLSPLPEKFSLTLRVLEFFDPPSRGGWKGCVRIYDAD